MNVRPYLMATLSGTQRAMASPGELAVRIGFYAVILIVFAALWGAAMDANGGSIEGYDYNAMLWYVVAAEGAVIATKPRMIEDIGNDIASGAVAVEMLRPISVAGFRIAAEYGEALVRFAGAALVGAMIVTLDAGAPPESAAIALAAPATLLAIACNLAAQFAFAAAAFWIEDAKASWFLYQKLVFLLGGMLMPLELFPDAVESVARWLPFLTTAYIPARLASGHMEPDLLLIQAVWLVALAGAALGTFALGEKRLQVAGG